MPRPLRKYIPGLSVHVIQRGNNRMPVFHHPADYGAFLELLRTACDTAALLLHAYVLMENHVHLIVTPTTEEGIPQAMCELGAKYARHHNRTYDRIGRVWNDRYRGILIHDDRYCLTCLRYVEQNPVRAGIAAAPEDYRWSSYRAHAFGDWPAWLAPHPVYIGLGATTGEREVRYRRLCALPLERGHAGVFRHDRHPAPTVV